MKIKKIKSIKYILIPIVCLVFVSILIYVLIPKPNDNITKSRTNLYHSINPKFKVGFGDRSNTSRQYVRFESSVSNTNPFEENELSFFDKVKGVFTSKKGFEMSLSQVRWGEREDVSVLDNIRDIASNLTLDRVETNTEVIEVGRLLGESTDESVSKQTVVNRDVYPGIDVEYQVLEGLGVKEEVVIRDMELYLNSCVIESECILPLNEFVFDLKLDDGVEIKRLDSLTKGSDTPPYYLSDSDGRYIAHFLPTFAIDGSNASTNDVSMDINHIEGNNYEIVLTLDPVWLFSNERVFPIRIDPSIVHDTDTEFNEGVYYRTQLVTGPNIQMDGSVNNTSISNTVGYWRLNEASGTGAYLLDSSGNNYHGTPTGTQFLEGLFDGSRRFSGTGDYITISNQLDFATTQAFSVESWVYVGNLDFRGTIISKYNGGVNGQWYLEINNGKLDFHREVSPWTLSSRGYLVANSWNHVAGTYDGTKMRVYINGRHEGTLTSGSVASNSQIVLIGSRYQSSTPSYLFKGIIDDVRVLNRVLSANEVKALHLLGKSYISSEYISSAVDLSSTYSELDLSWVSTNVGTGNPETPYSTTGLIAQWNFNETSGTTATSGGSCGTSCNGTLYNMTTTGQDVVVGSGWTSNNRLWGEGSLMFDGTNDRVVVSHNTALNNNTITIEAWVKPFSFTASGYNHIFDKDTQYALSLYNGKPAMYLSGAGDWWTPTVDNIPLMQWNHLVGTYNGTTKKLFLNGVEIASTSQTGNINTPGYSLGIGANQAGTNYFFKGIIDTTRIYSRALSESEIISNYNATSLDFRYRTSTDGSTWTSWVGGTETSIASDIEISSSDFWSDTNLVGYWKFDETSGTGAYLKDYSTNSNHGTPTNTSYATGILGGARSFGGADSVATNMKNEADSLYAGTGNAFTVSAWFRHDGGNTGNNGVMALGGGTGTSATFAVFIDSSANLRVLLRGSTTTVATSVSDGLWHYVAVTWDGTTARGYFDGSHISTLTVGTASQQTQNFSIGAANNGTNTYYNFGEIDEVRAYDANIGSVEIAKSYRLGREFYTTSTLTSTNLSSSSMIPLSVASDRMGSFVEASIANTAYANYETDTNTVGFWRLEEDRGWGSYLQDSSSAGNNANPNSTIFVSGALGSARQFDGTDDYLATANIGYGSSNQITVEGWVNFSSCTGDSNICYIVSKHRNTGSSPYTLWVNGSSGVAGFTVMGTAISSSSIMDGKWHHVVGTISSTTSKLYVDGVLVATGTVSPASNTELVTIGGDDASATYRPFNGMIDEVRISNIARSADDIRQAYEFGIGKRRYPITIDFGADLDSTNLITGSTDTSFTIDATERGLANKASNINKGEKIIVQENVDGTVYWAQGEVATANTSTGAITVTSWDAGSTFPTGGYTANADVFKWQKEYWKIGNTVLDDHIDAITKLSFRITNETEGRNIYVDDISHTTGYLTTPSTLTFATASRYFQYMAVFTSTDTNVSPIINEVEMTYSSGPTMDQIMRHGKWFDTSGTKQNYWWVGNN